MSTAITVYAREHCHRCEAVRHVGESADADVTLGVVDVDEDPEHRSEYGDRIPYVFVDDRPAFEVRVDEAARRERLTR